MEQEEFRKILTRYRLGQASPEEEKLIDEWYKALGEGSDTHEPRADQELEQYYWKKLEAFVDGDETKSRFIFPWLATGIAASMLIAAAFLYLYLTNTSVRRDFLANEKQPLEVKKNTTSTAQQFTLPDGSSVTLKPGSSIKFSPDFNMPTREVYLEGEGFFEVVHREDQPFLVYAKDVTTKVLGTSFTVRAFKEDQDVVVAVRTGKVSVFTKLDKSIGKSEVILTANQQLVFNKDQERLSRGIVDSPQPLAAQEDIVRLRFEEAPVTEIFNALEKLYGVDIVFDDAVLASCTLTTSITDGDLYNKLDLITRAIGARYFLEENRVIVQGKECN
jgi:transmembrane sensor